jgi:hypothetical protein
MQWAGGGLCIEPAGGSERSELAGDSPRGAWRDLILYLTPLSGPERQAVARVSERPLPVQWAWARLRWERGRAGGPRSGSGRAVPSDSPRTFAKCEICKDTDQEANDDGRH